MNKPNVRSLAITTLSPVHVGCDEVFEPSNFVIADGVLHVLDPADIVAALEENEMQKLLHLADEREPIGMIQQFFKVHREKLAQFSSQTVDVAPDIAQEYETKTGQVQQRGADGRAVYNLFPMARTATNSLDGIPYLPGSSLKGALRTAWLSHLNKGNPATEAGKDAGAKLQQRLLNYQPGKFENDPFRHVLLADAHATADQTSPPTRIIYAVSKKKRPSERGSPELKVFLEALRETLPDAFIGELRLTGKISWNDLCDACNKFYRPQLENELDHEQFRPLLESQWRNLVSQLLAGEMGDLMKERQGFLLRVGKHSGAESVTLDGVRSIKILGAKGERPSYRPQTTEKRFASVCRNANQNLLPFGWLWVSSCDDTHQHLAIALHNRLAQHAQPIREAHAARLAAAEERVERRAEAQRAAIQHAIERQAEAQAAAAAQALRETTLAAMSDQQRQIEELREFFQMRAAQLGAGKEMLNGNIHNRARQLAQQALESSDWPAQEKHALADLLTEWLPKLVSKMDKDQLKKLKLAALRA